MKRLANALGLLVCLVGGGQHPAVAQPATVPSYAPVVAGRPPQFPADLGSHPEFRTEWWYVTGWLQTAEHQNLGFQVTFFRTRPTAADANPSRFAARQLLIAHCAISDPQRGRLWQDQRIRRAGLGLADASVGDTRVYIGDWSLTRQSDDTYRAVVAGDDFGFTLTFTASQAVMLNGDRGVSRKGPESQAASYYYSLPHLRAHGSVMRQGRSSAAEGEAWLDHEWSSEYLDKDAVGWDWIGMNLDDGSALMAFRIRDAAGGVRWTGGTLRGANGSVQVLDRTSLVMTPQRQWRSPRTATLYPVEWTLHAAGRDFALRPLMDDQENDTRLSTGAIYWEGAVRLFEQDRAIGRGYLELTGYGERLNLR